MKTRRTDLLQPLKQPAGVENTLADLQRRQLNAQRGLAQVPPLAPLPTPIPALVADLIAYLKTLERGEREAELGGVKGYLSGEQVAPEWYSAIGDFFDPTAGGPSQIYLLAKRLQGARLSWPFVLSYLTTVQFK